MTFGNISLNNFDTFRVSVPLRLDIGGTWDLKAFALPFESIKPCTVTIALDLPTTLTFSSRDDDLIQIRDDSFIVTTRLHEIDFRSPFGWLLAICSHYGFSGCTIEIEYSVPPRSGLGGSGALGAGLIYGINHICDLDISLHDIAIMVHDIEEGLRFSYCGLQDQCAALYGGVNKWTWHYSKQQKFTRESLLEPEHYHEISDRLLIAYLGRGHGADINQQQVDSLYDLHTRRHWFMINNLTYVASKAIMGRRWVTVRDCIEQENKLRCRLVPERETSETDELWFAIDETNAALGVAGAGAGGCVFAFCDKPAIIPGLVKSWQGLLSGTPKSAIIINPKIAENGVWMSES